MSDFVTKIVLKGKKKPRKTKFQICLSHSGKQEAGAITCVCSSLWQDEREPLSFDFCATIPLFYTSFIYYSCTVHILIMFLTNIDYYTYFTVPAISFAVFFHFCFL